MKNLIKGMWNLLGEKGKFATIIGFCYAAPYNAVFMFNFFKGVSYDYDQLMSIVIVNIIGMMWFILPSKFTIESPKFKFIVED